VRDPSIFGDLAEKVLAIYQLKPPPEQRLKLQSKAIQLNFLPVYGPINYIFR
jgi:hypothetical protein